MTIDIIDTSFSREAKICVIGVGGGGNNAVDRMIADGILGVEFVAVNTDSQVLRKSQAPVRIQIGEKLTKGLGAGGKPDVGKRAAEESQDIIADLVEGMDMVFITAGMGGGTGTGAAPIIAAVCKGKNVLTVGVVTKPFTFEGSRRMKNAMEGIDELIKNVDTLVVIPNQRIIDIVDPNLSFRESLKKADETLRQGVRGISDLITNPGDINLDFADVKSIMADMGVAHMGIGRATGKNRAEAAAEEAINSPFLETSMEGAKNVLVNIAGGLDITFGDFNKVGEHINKTVSADANIITGTSIDETLGDELVVTVIATGFSSHNTRSVQSIHEQSPRAFTPNQTVPGTVTNFPGNQQQGQGQGFRQSEDLKDIKDVTENSDVLTLPVFLQNSARNRNKDRDRRDY